MKNFDWLLAADPGDRLRMMHAMGYLKIHLPEVHLLYGVPQRPQHHPEVDVGIHIELCLNMAAQLNLSHRARFAVLVHDLGKALSPPEQWPSHIDHEVRGMIPVENVCDRLQVPADWKTLALLVCEHHLRSHRILGSTPRTIVGLVDNLGDYVNDFTGACEADARGRLGLQDRSYSQAKFLRHVAGRLREIPCLGLNGEDSATRRVQNERRRQRLVMVDQLLQDYLLHENLLEQAS